MNDIDYQKIASNYNITVHRIRRGDKYHTAIGDDVYLNRSWSGGINEIIIGIFDDKDEEAASFFHELGHCISRDLGNSFDNIQNGSFHSELDAWMVGLIEGYKYGYLLPVKAFDSMVDCLKNYIKQNEQQ